MFHYRRESENGNLNADSARMSIARKADQSKKLKNAGQVAPVPQKTPIAMPMQNKRGRFKRWFGSKRNHADKADIHVIEEEPEEFDICEKSELAQSAVQGEPVKAEFQITRHDEDNEDEADKEEQEDMLTSKMTLTQMADFLTNSDSQFSQQLLKAQQQLVDLQNRFGKLCEASNSADQS